MSESLQRTALVMVLTELAQSGERWVPFGVSGRHVHLSEEAVACLFGHPLTPRNALSQPGQFACQETVDLCTPGGVLKGIRVLGPERSYTQVELGAGDCRKLGLDPPVRLSGQLSGSPGGVLIGPAGEYALDSGVILAMRHLHLSPDQARAYGLKNGDAVSVEIEGPRPGIMGGIPVRVGKEHTLDLHIDADEANGWLIQNGDIARISSGKATAPGVRLASPSALSLITEADVNEAASAGQARIVCRSGGIVTPAAWDRAAILTIEITKEM